MLKAEFAYGGLLLTATGHDAQRLHDFLLATDFFERQSSSYTPAPKLALSDFAFADGLLLPAKDKNGHN